MAAVDHGVAPPLSVDAAGSIEQIVAVAQRDM
jgi:hypothetical protein